jgi:alpha-glucosidase (family GH31 glycosyl hydrolase)
VTGPWPDRRYSIHFTGDTFPTWEILRFEVGFTIAEGATGFPYVSHDLGSFFGKHLPDDLYLRWVALGVFQPIFRLHSHHGDRLPWDYDEPTRLAAEKLLRLRESLIPYLYTLAREAFDTGVPLVRGLFLDHPRIDESWELRNAEYFLGDALLVVPISAADGTALAWIPPGTWINIFTDERVVGPAQQLFNAQRDTIPVFARAGAIVPRQPAMSHVGERPVDPLLLDVYAGADGTFTLYEDEGEGLGYLAGKFQRVAMRYAEAARELSIEPPRGHYDGAPTQRSYVVSLFNVEPPAQVTLDGNALPSGAWRYDAARRALTVELPAHAVDKRLVLQLR